MKEDYPDDTIRYAIEFVKPVLKVSDDILCVSRCSNHEFTFSRYELLLTVNELCK